VDVEQFAPVDSQRAHGEERGFTLIDLVLVAAVLALLGALALPSYLGARNKAAIRETNGMAQQWRSLAYGCYLPFLNPALCDGGIDQTKTQRPVAASPPQAAAGARGGASTTATPQDQAIASWGGSTGRPNPFQAPAGHQYQPVYRLTGIMGEGPRLVAIFEDKDGSHVVSSGDLLAPGVRVIAIYPLRDVVQLNQNGATVEVHLATAQPK